MQELCESFTALSAAISKTTCNIVLYGLQILQQFLQEFLTKYRTMEKIDNHNQNEHVKIMETKMIEHFRIESTVGVSEEIDYRDPVAVQ